MKQEEIDKMFENRWRIKSDCLEDMIMYRHCRINGVAQSMRDHIKAFCRDFFEAGIELGKDDTSVSHSKCQQQNNIEIRRKNFWLSVYTSDNNQKYGARMLQDFFEYWTESNPSKTKMRFEMQKTWDIDRRLARWARNNFNRYDRQPTPEQQQSKLTDILIG